jgi:hypothetical protein
MYGGWKLKTLLLLLLQTFIRAKKAPRCPWQVFVASAHMEWHHAGDNGRDVARKIFEKGLEVAEFATEPDYVLAYATFLRGECGSASTVACLCAASARGLVGALKKRIDVASLLAKTCQPPCTLLCSECGHFQCSTTNTNCLELLLLLADTSPPIPLLLPPLVLPADIGDSDNTRALFERVLTEETNRKSTKLWEHYLGFEFEMGDLQTALRLEKRAREALGEAPGAPAGGGASARNIQLLLLRYQFNQSLPCPPGQRGYLEYLTGKGPAPPGFEKQQRPSRSDSAAAEGAPGDR